MVKRNSPRKVNPLILILSATLLILIAGFFIRGLKENASPTNQVVNSTSDWKTYTNTKYGFEFKYPIDWPEPEVQDHTTQSGNNLYSIFFGEKLEVTVTGLSTPTSLEEIITQNKNALEVSTENYKAYKIDRGTGKIEIGISKNLESTRVILLEYIPGAEQKIYDQILSTFKFTEDTSAKKAALEKQFWVDFKNNRWKLESTRYPNIALIDVSGKHGAVWVGFEDSTTKQLLQIPAGPIPAELSQDGKWTLTFFNESGYETKLRQLPNEIITQSILYSTLTHLDTYK